MNDSDLFADLVEYREAFAMLKEFGEGYGVTVQRRWPTGGRPYFVVTVERPSPINGRLLNDWRFVWKSESLLEAARRAAKSAREHQAAGGYRSPTRVRTTSRKFDEELGQ